MLEDLVYELLPVVGFAALASSIFVIFVMKKAAGAFNFILFLAVADVFLGVTLIIAGFYGVMTTIYGEVGEAVNPIACVFSKAIHLPMAIFSDALHSLLMLWFSADRLLQMLIPVQYTKVANVYSNWAVFFVVAFGSCGAMIPSLREPIEQRDNLTNLIPPLCRFQQVFGQEYYSLHIWAVQWCPIVGLGILGASLMVFGIRSMKQRWTYNWSENGSDTVQLMAACILRCLMAAISIHVPLLLVANQPPEAEISLLTDFFVRISVAVCLPVLTPIYYLLAMPLFLHNVQMMFNKYSHNTKRIWQSASDPPTKPDEYADPHGDRNPFGSWYSSGGNVNGEAGIPTEERAGIERSVSFYYAEEEKESQQPPPDVIQVVRSTKDARLK